MMISKVVVSAHSSAPLDFADNRDFYGIRSRKGIGGEGGLRRSKLISFFLTYLVALVMRIPNGLTHLPIFPVITLRELAQGFLRAVFCKVPSCEVFSNFRSNSAKKIRQKINISKVCFIQSFCVGFD